MRRARRSRAVARAHPPVSCRWSSLSQPRSASSGIDARLRDIITSGSQAGEQRDVPPSVPPTVGQRERIRCADAEDQLLEQLRGSQAPRPRRLQFPDERSATSLRRVTISQHVERAPPPKRGADSPILSRTGRGPIYERDAVESRPMRAGEGEGGEETEHTGTLKRCEVNVLKSTTFVHRLDVRHRLLRIDALDRSGCGQPGSMWGGTHGAPRRASKYRPVPLSWAVLVDGRQSARLPRGHPPSHVARTMPITVFRDPFSSPRAAA